MVLYWTCNDRNTSILSKLTLQDVVLSRKVASLFSFTVAVQLISSALRSETDAMARSTTSPDPKRNQLKSCAMNSVVQLEYQLS